MMSEARIAAGDTDAGLAERFDEEISAFNVAEAEIRRRGCDRVALSTRSFQGARSLRPLRHPPDEAARVRRFVYRRRG
jgi:hypothetical protein